MTVYIQVEFKNGSITILDVKKSEVKEWVRMLCSFDNKAYNYVVNVTVIEKALQ